MLDETTIRCYTELLRSELVCALGCTEPIALAYAASLAAHILGEPCEHLHMQCSGNIIKNVKSVAVPNAEGMKGVEAASVLGMVGGDPAMRLEVLESVTHADVERTRELVTGGLCSVELLEGVPNLYIIAQAAGPAHKACVTIADRHTNVVAASRDSRALASDELLELGLPVPRFRRTPVPGGCHERRLVLLRRRRRGRRHEALLFRLLPRDGRPHDGLHRGVCARGGRRRHPRGA